MMSLTPAQWDVAREKAWRYQVPRTARPERVVVGLSGGVDSSVTAWLLKEMGHEVIGVTLRLAREHDLAHLGRCCGATDLTDAEELCNQLGIEFHLVDRRERFNDQVFNPFVKDYRRGLTPSPCMACNYSLKFGDLYDIAREVGAKLATGHYVRKTQYNGHWTLARPRDRSRDQSYFLYGVAPDVLANLMFPLGDLDKLLVRGLADMNGFKAAKKNDSMELCFAPDGDHAGAVERAAGKIPRGDLVAKDGTVLGDHDGIHRYTIGQRKGLNVQNTNPASRKLYVIDINADQNRVVVGEREDLKKEQVTATEIRTLVPYSAWPTFVGAQIRSTSVAQAAKWTQKADFLYLYPTTPVEAVAPGQAVVLYDNDIMLGGARIVG